MSTFKCAKVAILGRPNAGKSTLLNALLEVSVSATSKRPQTTRSNIRGVIQLHTGKKWTGQLILVDTPGLNFKKGLLDRAMHMSVEDALKEVDVVIWVADSRSFVKDLKDIELGRPGSDKLAAWLRQRLKAKDEIKKTPWILALSKMDITDKAEILPVMERAALALPEFTDIVPIAAEKTLANPQSNLEALLKIIEHAAPESKAQFTEEAWTDLNDRQLVQNLIREAIFRQGREEVPYQCDATVVRYVEPVGRRKMPEVDATIWVAKDSLKPILVGHGGSRIKEIGISVRDRYKEITGDEMVLRLFVKVVDKWESRPQSLAELGYVIA